jgi:hypothetical protein
MKPKEIRIAAFLLAQSAPPGSPLRTIAEAVADNPENFTRWLRRNPKAECGGAASTQTRHFVVPAEAFAPMSYDGALAAARDLSHATGRPWMVLSEAMAVSP